MPRPNPNEISIETESGARVTLTLANKPGLDQDLDAAMSTVKVTANLRHENGDIGTDPHKDHLLVGHTIGTAPGENSVLGVLQKRLNERFHNRVHVELEQEDPVIRGLRAQKGEKIYNVTLYPIPPDATSVRFEAAVRKELNTIKMEMQPRAPEQNTR